MNKLFKNIGKLILWIIALIIILVVVAYLTVSYWIVPVVGKVVPQVTQTTASLQSADISLLKGRIALKGLKIGNPKGFAAPESFKLNEISVQFQPSSLLSDKIIVDKVLIDGTQIAMELDMNGQVNLLALNDNVQKYLNASAQPAKETKPVKTQETKQTASKSVVIKDLQILNSSIQFGMMGKMSTLKLPNIQEKNIGEKKKTNIKDSIMLIVNKLTLQPIEEITKAGQKALTNALDYIQKKQGNSSTVKSLKSALPLIFG